METKIKSYKAWITIERDSGMAGCGPTGYEMELSAENDQQAIERARQKLKDDWKFYSRSCLFVDKAKVKLLSIRVREERQIIIEEEISQSNTPP